MERVLSGIQPTGDGIPHLGNYLGALRRFAAFQEGADCLYCVVDLHATTVPYDPGALRRASVATAAEMMACGVDPGRSVLFRQSAVAGHAVLAAVLMNLATLGNLERMTQFKDKSRLDGGNRRDAIGLGLLTYPVLMAADILLHRATVVPVGDDQRQHLQLTRQLARAFNVRFGRLFPEPREALPACAARVMSLRDPTRKMSKTGARSPEEVLYLMDGADEAARKIRRAVSETEPLPSEAAGLAGRPAAANLVSVLAALEGRSEDAVLSELGGRGFADLKRTLTEAYVAEVVPIGERMRKLLSDGETAVRAVLKDGAERARSSAAPVLTEVAAVCGLDESEA